MKGDLFYNKSQNRDCVITRSVILRGGGFTLVETLVAVAIFVLVSTAMYNGFAQILKLVKDLRIKNTMVTLANEQMEIIRNLSYEDVGVVGGLPDGVVPREQNINRSGIDFIVTTTIRNIDDPFDGTIGGVPNDLSPADNKLVEVEIACVTCGLETTVFSTRVAPVSLETTGDNGALFVQVLDANGQPVSGADVHIENNTGTSSIIIDDVTNINGMLQIVDAPPGVQAYEITVTKSGYSTDQTYEVGAPSNPAPNKPHANVVQGLVTQVSFTIDELSEVNVNTLRSSCQPVGNVDFRLTGSKEIGFETKKYDFLHTTNGAGFRGLSDIEWDTYELLIEDAGYFLAGTNTILPLNVSPGTQYNVDLILEDADPNGLLVKVKDGSTGLPISDANVTIEGNGVNETLKTGRGFIAQTDWSGGSGQSQVGSLNRYFSSDGNIDTSSSVGEVKLLQFGGIYQSDGFLTSSIFDTGTTSNFYSLNWEPTSQAPEVGNDSIRLQVATVSELTATTTWEFVGPDGTSSSYFTNPGEAFNSIHNGDRYVRYAIYLHTDNNFYTPFVSDVSFTFSTECTPSGQVYFDNNPDGSYEITVQKSGYQTYSTVDYSLNNNWQELEVTLVP